MLTSVIEGTTMQNTLLVIDDEKAILRSLRRTLHHAGYKVVTAESGTEALQILEDNRHIRVVISDYRMPNMTGGELLTKIKQRFSDVIGIMLTGYADIESVIAALNSGAVYKYLTKPWNDTTLLAEVESAFLHCQELDKLRSNSGSLGIKNLLPRHDVMDLLGQWMSSGIQTTAVYLDVNMFRSYNDSLGYEVADQILIALAETLVQNLPESALLGQMGGDEFVMLMPEVCSETETQNLIETLLLPFHKLQNIAGRELHISFGAGYAISPDDGDTPEALVRNAQAALFSYKSSGSKPFTRYRSAMNARSRELMSLRSDLYRALEKDQFSVVYQPKVSLSTGLIVGAESLLRWQHDSLGMISPATFIPLAESSGLIEPIGEWVLSTASSQRKVWQLQGLPSFLLSVNLSGRQLREKTLAEKVKQILDISGIQPTDLELEITETFLIQDIDSSVRLLNELKALGIKLSIDDFGTGYSSLSYLNRLPIDTLKIDRSFVKELPQCQDRVDLVRNVIQMSHDLGMSVVAEGVETQAQLDTLNTLKCDEIQGYFYSPPVSAEQFRVLLENQPLVGKPYQL